MQDNIVFSSKSTRGKNIPLLSILAIEVASSCVNSKAVQNQYDRSVDTFFIDEEFLW
jgi:hypothetical protein